MISALVHVLFVCFAGVSIPDQMSNMLMIQVCLTSKQTKRFEATSGCGGGGGTHLTQVFFDGICDVSLLLGQ